MIRPPQLKKFADAASALGRNPIDHEIMGEKAAALGRAAEKAESRLARLRESDGGNPERARLVREAAQAVYAYFIQRELCGFRRHDEIVRRLEIPREVLVRLGAL